MTSRSFALLLLLAGVSISRQGSAAEPPIERVLVLDLASTGVDPTLGRNLSEVFTMAVRDGLAGATVIGQGEINAMLAVEKQRDVLGCSGEVSCLAEIGGALGADHLTVGSIGRIGNVYLLTLKLVDTRRAVTVRQISEKIDGGAERLIAATAQWGAHLVDPAKVAGVGYIDIRGSGDVSVDGKAAGPAPVRHYAVMPGPVRIVWQQGSERAERTVDVEPYTDLRIDPAPAAVAAPAPAPAAQVERRHVYARATFGLGSALSAPGKGNTATGSNPAATLEVGYSLPSHLQLFATAGSFGGRFKTELDPGNSGAGMDFQAAGAGIGYAAPGALLLSPGLGVMYGRVMNHYCAPNPSGNGCVENTSSSYPYGFGSSAWLFDASLKVGYALGRWLEIGARLDLVLTKVDNGTIPSAAAGLMLGMP